MRFMAEVIFKIIKKFMIYSRMHIFIEGSENCDFLDNLEKFVRKFVKYQEYDAGFFLLMFFYEYGTFPAFYGSFIRNPG